MGNYVCLNLDVRVINELIEDLGRLETAKTRMNLENATTSQAATDTQQNPQPTSDNPTHLASHNSTFGISGSNIGHSSRASINRKSSSFTKKMVENEIEGVQFNRKRMNSSLSNSSAGRSLSGDTPRFGDQVG